MKNISKTLNFSQAETFLVTETPTKLKKAIEKRTQTQAVISIPNKKNEIYNFQKNSPELAIIGNKH